MKSTLLLIGILISVMLFLNGCSTVHGVGEDLDTLGRGMSNHHDTPKAIQQDSSRN
jgi:predicted small secreted protein